ncbi:OTU protein [Metarhizium acridum]|uniref:OTU domain-containing protein 6B n=1 Tax=Metarhizium acridum (strain CQMa 102) TaxID=655827 RepID=E9E1V8_METAQ|nr:OTU domain-containing protein 6B [Metarhizium acridum CQMa 102]EFY90055.1 OTU domain-containing protein 6B [Metarhizium acridum CQMa 102]KAG8418247.1 OTU protein [Metarhizium acridum]
MEGESLDQMTARHRRELKDLQGRITSKKKNATKKTRKGVNDECSEMERQLREKQAAEVASLDSTPHDVGPEHDDNNNSNSNNEANGLERAAAEADDETIGTAVDKMRLNSDAPAAPGKKRNRQKERLARRAAEQEAAAQQAEEEASGMTDHRARESEYMKKTFAAHGLVEKDIEPDGHCLFSAVADQLSQNGIPTGRTDASEPEYRTVRRAAAAYMGDNGDDFAPFLEGDLESHLAKVRDTAEWGGQLELMALARRYGAEIRVVQDGRMERIGEEEGAQTGRVLWLAYYRHGYGLGEHYNSLRRK